MTSHPEQIKAAIAFAGLLVGSIGVIVIVGGFMMAIVVFFVYLRRMTAEQAYKSFRRNLGRSILLGLEFLIAADIINTVIVSTTMENILVLASIILIRTFLGFTLHLEVEGCWPWQKS